MRLIIIGASGVIGGALYDAAIKADIPVVGTSHTHPAPHLRPFDMKNHLLRDVVMDLSKNDVVFLLAGYSSPSWVHAHKIYARKINHNCTMAVMEQAAKVGARIVFMSSDQVFDGETGGYTESSPTWPKNFYGLLKEEVETDSKSFPNIVIARTGWNVPWQIGQHCPVAQCYDALLRQNPVMAQKNVFNINDVDDTAKGLIAIAKESKPHRIYHLVGKTTISRIALAQAIMRQSTRGLRMTFKAVPFTEIPYSEPRPQQAWLSSEFPPIVEFTAPEDVIARKVDLLDFWHERARTATTA
jgi:dTDP-4-dehydrorhamnose reductase